MKTFLVGTAAVCALCHALIPAPVTPGAVANGPSINGAMVNGPKINGPKINGPQINGIETGATGLTTTAVKAENGKLVVR